MTPPYLPHTSPTTIPTRITNRYPHLPLISQFQTPTPPQPPQPPTETPGTSHVNPPQQSHLNTPTTTAATNHPPTRHHHHHLIMSTDDDFPWISGPAPPDIARSNLAARKRRIIVLTVVWCVAVILIASICIPVFLWSQNLETRHSLVNLQENCDDIMASVKSSISFTINVIFSFKWVMETSMPSSPVSLQQFQLMGKLFPSLSKEQFQTAIRISWAQRVTRSERSNWEARNGIVVSEQEGVSTPFLTNTTRTRIKDDADIYFPLTLVSDNLNPIIGLDVYNDSLRSPLIIDSLSKRGLLVSTMFTTDLDGQTANLVRFVLPVSLDASDTVSGVLIGVLMLSSIVSSAIEGRQSSRTLNVMFSDASTHEVFYATSTLPTRPTITQNLTIGDRTFLLNCSGTPTTTTTPLLLLSSLLLMTLTLSTLLTTLLSRFLHARTKSHLRLQNLAHRGEVVRVRASAVIGAISDPMVVFEGVEGRIVGANSEAERVCGDVETVMELFCSDEGVSAWTQCGMRSVGVRKRDGGWFHAEANFSTVKGLGEVWVVIFRDMTIKMRDKEELELAKMEAEEANKQKSDFLAWICHELRNPLHAVIGLTEMTLSLILPYIQRPDIEAPPPPLDSMLSEATLGDTVGSFKPDSDAPPLLEAHTNLHSIISASRVMSTIVNDVLDLSKLEAGKMQMERIPVNIPKVVQEACAGQLKRSVEVRWEVGDGVGWVLGDPTRLVQILTNLIGNSVKFTPEGTVTVKATCLETIPITTAIDPTNDAPHLPTGHLHKIRFSVQDTGIGIAESEIPKLFKAYSQANASIGRNFGGTGLGLSIVQHFVTRMGGTIQISSLLNVGTTIHFDLLMSSVHSPSLSTSPPPSLSSSLRILLVEDNQVLQKVGLALLKKQGFRVDVASDGIEALEKLEMGGWEVCLMDLQMPRMDGMETLREIRRRGWGVTVVALTANALESDRERCERVGFDGFLTKPFNFGEFAGLLKRIEERKNGDGVVLRP